jgi:Papain fold toxin 2
MTNSFNPQPPIARQLRPIITNFPNLECESCARAIRQWLRDNGNTGQLLRLRTSMGEDYIVSQRRLAIGDAGSITENGVHYGVKVDGFVFDNRSMDGLPLDQWLADFECQSGDFLLDTIE